MEASNFFQNEEKRCRANAEMATTEGRDFWLDLACRWRELYRARDEKGSNIKAARMFRSGRTIHARKARLLNQEL
jgi:hypothetical protein